MEQQPTPLTPREHLEVELVGEPQNSPWIRGMRDAVRWRLANQCIAVTHGHDLLVAGQKRGAIEKQIAAERIGPDGERYGQAFDDEKNGAVRLQRYLGALHGLYNDDELLGKAGEHLLKDLAAIDETLPPPGPEA